MGQEGREGEWDRSGARHAVEHTYAEGSGETAVGGGGKGRMQGRICSCRLHLGGQEWWLRRVSILSRRTIPIEVMRTVAGVAGFHRIHRR